MEETEETNGRLGNNRYRFPAGLTFRKYHLNN
jgi:hypothetical protein